MESNYNLLFTYQYIIDIPSIYPLFLHIIFMIAHYLPLYGYTLLYLTKSLLM